MVRDFVLDAMHNIDGGVLKDLLHRIELHIKARGGVALFNRMNDYVTGMFQASNVWIMKNLVT